MKSPSSKAFSAVHKLAEAMAQQHSDFWLTDFLRVSNKKDLSAVQAFQAAFVAGQNDFHYEAIRESRRAAVLFAANGNLPGELLARLQEVYALQRITAGEECLSSANRLRARVKQSRYPWLQGQLTLERATCANLATDYSTADSDVEASRKLAQEFGFGELAMRVIGLDAGMKRLQKKCDEAWRESVEGLKRYWQQSYSAERQYQFYSVMRQCAKSSHALYTTEALLRRSIQMLQEDIPDDQILRAMLYRRLATLLLEQHDESAAESAASEARRILKNVGTRDPTAEQYEARTHIELAEFELQREKPDMALATVALIPGALRKTDSFLRLDFYRIQGNARLQLHQLDEAASAYTAGIRVAEASLRHLKDDGDRLPWIRATDEIYRGIVQVLLQRKEDEKALALWEWSRIRSLDRNRPVILNGSRAGSATSFFKLSLPRVAEPHLVFASFQDRLQVWIVQGSRIESKQIPLKRSELLGRISEFSENCSNPESSMEQLERESRELYSLIVQPVIGSVSASETLVVELDQSLTALPIEALLDPQGRYLGETFALITSPGILSEGTLRAPLPAGLIEPFTIADGSAANGTGYLPGHDLATRSLQQSGARVEILRSSDASVARLKQLMHESTGFHFTGHGRQNGTGMALELAPGLFLRSQDLSRTLLPHLRLAVLAACQSGSAENGLLDAGNLVRSFIAAGVPNVVASRWNVDSKSTGQLMASFYTHLIDKTAAQALRAARKDMHLTKKHPYFWAAFNLTGRVS